MRRRPANLLRDERGAVAASYAIALMGLIVVAGVGYDYTRMVAVDSELQNAADQAALAAATQLDGLEETSPGAADGACARASEAAVNLLRNLTMLSNDGSGNQITITPEPECDAEGRIRFWQDKDKNEAAETDQEARFVEVFVNPRQALYALTPVMATFRGSGDLNAAAFAGVGSAVCKVPPIMICHPDPTQDIDWDDMEGIGVQATGHSTSNSGQGGNAGTANTGNTWSPGNFGFLQVEDADATNRNAALLRALAYANPPVDCVKVGDNRVSPGNPQGLYDAINTRFDIYDFPNNGNGNVLASCQGGQCPPSTNVVKDLINNSNNFNGNNACRMGNNRWEMPDNEFYPINSGGPYYNDRDRNGSVASGGEMPDSMGLPRDLCHYETFNSTGWCGNSEDSGRFGNGTWAINDYFKKNHNLSAPPSGVTTRYQAYRWELGLFGTGGSIPNSLPQRGRPVCYAGGTSGAAPNPKRRVMTIAVVSNCDELRGTAAPVAIDDWIDVFLVEPATDDAQRHNAYKDSIYFEVIGRSRLAGSGTYNSQEIRRDVPYLIE
jgi:Flp pilus assembly protein TadG